MYRNNGRWERWREIGDRLDTGKLLSLDDIDATRCIWVMVVGSIYRVIRDLLESLGGIPKVYLFDRIARSSG